VFETVPASDETGAAKNPSITGCRRRNFKLFFRISGFSELKCERTQLGMAHWQGRLSGVS
jgi:hypothetical protein